MGDKIKPIIFWYGFPVCGLLIKKVAEEFGDELIIITSNPALAEEEIEDKLRHKIIVLKNPDDIWQRREEFGDRNFIIHTGWVYKGWLNYDKEMRKRNNAKVIVAVDNRYRGDWRQKLGAFYFKFYLKKIFDATLVPGKSGQKLMKSLDMDEGRIYTGLYGAYEGIFNSTNPIETRNREFLFVGQLIKRKAVDILVNAFVKYKEAGGTWNLRIVGSGELEDMCHGNGIILEAFAGAEKIAEKMNRARVLVLPSRDDNWGTVACEAAACGMHVIGSTSAGSTEDIIEDGINGLVLSNISVEDIEKAFFYYERLPENELMAGSAVSREIAGKFDSRAYFNSFQKMVSDLSK